MGSVASINPGVASLLQTLSNIDPSLLQSPAEVSALEQASPGDLVQLSVQATQLQAVDAIFGLPDGSNTDTTANLQAPITELSDSALLSAASPADQLSNYQASLQSAETQGLFGTLLNVTG